MRATCDGKALEKVLKWHSSGSALREMHVSVVDGGLVVESSSPEAWRRSVLPAHDTADGEAILIWTRLIDQMRVGRGSPVHIERDGTVVVTKVGRSTARSPIVAQGGAHWTPTEPLAEVAEVDLADFEWALKAAATAAAKHSQKAAEGLKAVHVNVSDCHLVLSGTDAYRLGQVSMDCMTSQPGMWLVPPGSLVTSLPVMGDPLRLVTSGGHLGLADDSFQMLATSIAPVAGRGDGPPSLPFPKIKAALDRAQALPGSVVLPIRDLADSLASSGSGPTGQVVLSVGDDHVTVANRVSSDTSPGQTETVIDAVVDGMTGLTFAFNSTYLLEMLRTMRSDDVSLTTTEDPKTPLALREHGEESSDSTYLAALALVRL